MLLALFVILLILWLAGFFAFHVAGALIHLLLIVAVIVLVYHFMTGRRVGALPPTHCTGDEILGDGRAGIRTGWPGPPPPAPRPRGSPPRLRIRPLEVTLSIRRCN